MKLEFGGSSHKGQVRKINEDYYYIPCHDKPGDLAIIADGMGGHNAGEFASRLAVETIIEFLTNNTSPEEFTQNPMELIKEAIITANQEVFKMALSDEAYNGMGTTLVLAYFCKDVMYMGHVGDSRGYLLRNGELTQLTKDHSLVQELLDNGTITLDEIDNHPQKNIITRALGTESYIDVDCHIIPLETEDIILLCTDGLTLHVDLSDKISFLEGIPSMQEITSKLVEEAVKKGGQDNITLLAIKYLKVAEEG